MPRPRKGLKEPLSRERILETALRIVDSEGLPALNMRRLGRELDVEAMSLYRYIPNKEALLRELVTAMVEEIAPEVGLEPDWMAHLTAVMRAMRRVGRAHPDVFLLFATRRLNRSLTARGVEDLDTLRLAGFRPEQARCAVAALVSYVTGFVLLESAGQIEQLVALPNTSVHSEAAFEAGLSAILAGLHAQLMQAHEAPARRPRPRQSRPPHVLAANEDKRQSAAQP